MRLQPVRTHATEWDASAVQPTLNVTLDAGFVPNSSNGQMRLDMAHLVVLDNFIDEPTRSALLDAITHPGWDHALGPPQDKWERSTQDTPDHPRTWGLTHDALVALESSTLHAKIEVQSRLAALYPDCVITHQPSDAIQGPVMCASDPAPAPARPTTSNATRNLAADEQPSHPSGDSAAQQDSASEAAQGSAWQDAQGAHESRSNGDAGSDGHVGASGPVSSTYDCHAILANAAMRGDEYGWHQDADPQTFPVSSDFVSEYGQYTNREPGKPLFVSLLLYLNDHWPRDWAADTLFLDLPSDTSVMVRPKPYRAVLMDQDITHRLSAPTRAAGGVPRYSLVSKLVFMPKTPGQQCSIARPEWGAPTPFGSAAKAQAVIDELARKRRRTNPGQHAGAKEAAAQ